MGNREVFSVNGIFSGHPKGVWFVTVEGWSRMCLSLRTGPEQPLHGTGSRLWWNPRTRGGAARPGADEGLSA